MPDADVPPPGTIGLCATCRHVRVIRSDRDSTFYLCGVALLHSFGYEESRLAFHDAAKADPACSMAYWGVARTWYHPIWAPPSPGELKQGAAALDRALATAAKTGRERGYIDALAVFYK